MMIHFFAISYYFPCHLFSWSAAYLPPSYNFLRFRFFSTRGYIGYKMAQLSHDAWNIDCANDSAGSVKIWLTLTIHLVMNQAPGSSCLHFFGLIHCKQEPLRILLGDGLAKRLHEILLRVNGNATKNKTPQLSYTRCRLKSPWAKQYSKLSNY